MEASFFVTDDALRRITPNMQFEAVAQDVRRGLSICPKFKSKFARVVCDRAQLVILAPTPYVNYTGKLH
jgi:hypothetical protein